jgi:acylphosphatase
MPSPNRSLLARGCRLLGLLAALFSGAPATAQAQWSGWAGLGGGITKLATAMNADGRMEVFAIGTDQALNHIWQTAPNGGPNRTAWSAWAGLSGRITEIATAVNRDGRIEVFAIDTDQALNHIWQTAPNGGPNQNAWSGWTRLAGGITHLATAVNQDGRIEVFAIGTDQALNHIWQTAPNGGPNQNAWSPWAGLAGGITHLATAVNQDGRVEVFAIGIDQALNHIWQTAPNGGPNQNAWSPWAGLAGGIRHLATTVNQDGRVEVFAIGIDQALNHIWQTDANGGPNRTAWSQWAGLGGGIRHLAAAINQDGRVEVFAIGTDQALNHIWQAALNGGPNRTAWSQWAGLGGGIRHLATAVNQDGRVEVFAIGTDQALNHIWQTSPGGGFRVAVTTYHYDNMRSGWNPSETQLTPANVNSASFGLVARTALDEQVDAQPLVVPNQTISGQPGQHDVVYVATEKNTVYAIDASSGAVLLSRNFGIPVPQAYLSRWKTPLIPGCDNNGPNVGIAGTPVIDRASNTIFAITYTIRVDASNTPIAGSQAYQVHAIDLSSLTDKVPPAIISASNTLTGGGTVSFSAVHQRQRAGLVEANGNIYAGFGAFCDDVVSETGDPDHARGWVLGWRAGTLQPLAATQLMDSVASSQTNYFLSSVWMSGYGLAGDESGNIFFTTGNSDCFNYDDGADPAQAQPEPPCVHPGYSTYGGLDGSGRILNIQESVVKVLPDLTRVGSFFTPSNVRQLDQEDNDFSSGGVLLLPAQSVSIPHLAVAAGKDGRMFLLDRDDLGGYTSGGSDKVLNNPPPNIGRCWCGPSSFGGEGTVRVVSSGGTLNQNRGLLQVWRLDTASLTLVQEASAVIASGQLPGFFTSVSSDGSKDAIIWAVSRPQDSSPANVNLYAFNAYPPLTPLFGSPLPAGHWQNTGGNANLVPVVANGKVYVASNKQLSIFGLCPCLATPAPETPPTAQAHAHLASEASIHELYGAVRSAAGSHIAVQTRTGTLVQVDTGRTSRTPPAIGSTIHAAGTYDTDGMLTATMIVRAIPSPALWPPDY